MKIYKDKTTGKYKVGPNGAAIYETEREAKNAGLNNLIELIWALNKKRGEAVK